MYIIAIYRYNTHRHTYIYLDIYIVMYIDTFCHTICKRVADTKLFLIEVDSWTIKL